MLSDVASLHEKPETVKTNISSTDDFLVPHLPYTSNSLGTEKQHERNDFNPSEESTNAEEKQKVQYNEPIWARVPNFDNGNFYLEVIKNGTIIETIQLEAKENRSYLTIGRFDPCDIKLEHPSVSRFHAILQYGEFTRGNPQWHIYDMNSTHGIKVNKASVKKNSFIPLDVGHIFQIAASTRIFVLSGGPKNEEKETIQNLSTQKELTTSQSNEKHNLDRDASNDKHRFYENDPIHWLEKYFEREGVPMAFKFTKNVENSSLCLMSTSKKSKSQDSDVNWICSIELVSDVSLAKGVMVSAMAPSRKLAQSQCALLACERLDEACLLQISSIWNKRITYAENDFYDDDEDVFYDRTGQIEEQVMKRKRRYEGDLNENTKAKTYNDLLEDVSEINKKLEIIRSEIQRIAEKNDFIVTETDEENKSIKSTMNFSIRMVLSQMKNKQKKLIEERTKLEKLIEIAKPSCEFQMQINCKHDMPAEHSNANAAFIPKSTNEKINIAASHVTNAEVENYRPDIEQQSQTMPTASTSEDVNCIQKAQKQSENLTKKEKFYAPTMPSKEQAKTIAPKFGILTKQELIELKLYQRQREKERETSSVKQETSKQYEHDNKFSSEDTSCDYESSEKYATWLPPDNQLGDGSTQLNQKFAGRY